MTLSARSSRATRRRCSALITRLLLLTLALLPTLRVEAAPAAGWREALGARVERIERESPGRLGLYVKRLDTGEEYAWQADRPWYLGSTTKLPLAIAVLQDVDRGRRRLDDQLALQESDKADGSGNLVWQAAGSRYPLDVLLERMLMVSDSTAADLLMRSVGVEALNRRAAEFLGSAVDITPFSQVRREVYGELHPAAAKLSNRQLLEIAAAPMGPARVEAVRRTLGVAKGALRVRTIGEAYDRYYAERHNTATLTAYGTMLEKLVRGQLLAPPTQQRLYKDLKFDTYDAYRLEAGLPRGTRFIHKTGTQYQRACHMGVIDPQDGGRGAIVVAACAEGLDESRAAGRVFERLGRAITETLLKPAAQTAAR